MASPSRSRSSKSDQSSSRRSRSSSRTRFSIEDEPPPVPPIPTEYLQQPERVRRWGPPPSRPPSRPLPPIPRKNVSSEQDRAIKGQESLMVKLPQRSPPNLEPSHFPHLGVGGILIGGLDLQIDFLHEVNQWDPVFGQTLKKARWADALQFSHLEPKAFLWLLEWMTNRLKLDDEGMVQATLTEVLNAALVSEQFSGAKFWRENGLRIVKYVRQATEQKRLILEPAKILKIDLWTIKESPIRQLVFDSIVWRSDFNSYQDFMNFINAYVDEHENFKQTLPMEPWKKPASAEAAEKPNPKARMVTWAEQTATETFKESLQEGFHTKGQTLGNPTSPFLMPDRELLGRYNYPPGVWVLGQDYELSKARQANWKYPPSRSKK